MYRAYHYIAAVAIFILPVLLYAIPKEAIFSGRSLCIWYNITGHECVGCGITRAIFSVAYLDFSGAWAYNKGVIVVLPIIIYLWAKEVLKQIRLGNGKLR